MSLRIFKLGILDPSPSHPMQNQRSMQYVSLQSDLGPLSRVNLIKSEPPQSLRRKIQHFGFDFTGPAFDGEAKSSNTGVLLPKSNVSKLTLKFSFFFFHIKANRLQCKTKGFYFTTCRHFTNHLWESNPSEMEYLFPLYQFLDFIISVQRKRKIL